MPLTPGTQIGSYEVLAPLGAGGMGEVYRATDARLKRAVALKALPDEVARDPERLARFEREAHVLASLNHPNIGSIYGIEESGRTRCLVLELVEGETLAVRIDSGALSVSESLQIALQIAEGLEAAHEKGIVHRDLKPANVMITPEGSVKVLDFGLAKALEADPASGSVDASLSPTMTAAATRLGVILGTAGYMSPEQAKGRAVDRRSDIWAFGVILFEMLTGKRMFAGETVSDTLAAVLRADLEWDSLPPDLSSSTRRLLQRCLERDPRIRLRDIGEARIVLGDLVAGRSIEEPRATQAASRSGWSPRATFSIVAAVACAAAAVAGFAAWSFKPLPTPPVRRFQLPVPGLASGPAYAISPDGNSAAYVSKDRLWIRRLDKLEAREISGTEGAADPFWSPDSQWVGYIAESKMRKVAVAGGESSIISRLPDSVSRGVGASWASDGTIVFSTGSSPLYEVPARGGDAHTILDADATLGDDHFHEPSWLPGKRGIIFTVHRKDAGTDTLALLAGGVRKTLLQLEKQEIWHAVYSPTGHILFRRQPDNEGIWALPFSLSKLEPTGDAFLVLPGGNIPSVSDDGTMVCILGGSSGMQQLAWVDRKGEVQQLVGQPQPDILFVSLSPDGHHVAVQSHEGDNWDVWVHDVTRGTKTRLTFETSMEGNPAWSPGGDRIAYFQQDKMMIKAADGAGQPESIGDGAAPSFSPDGKHIVYEVRSNETKIDIWIEPIGQDGTPAALIHTKASEWGPRVSPDGRYLTYVSDESGKPEVYLARFPSGDGKWQVSVNGGNQAIWSRRGDEIVYRVEDSLMAVPVESGAVPVLGTPVKLFDGAEKGLSLRSRAFDVSPDGKQIITAKRLEKESGRDQLIVITNWFSEFANSP